MTRGAGRKWRPSLLLVLGGALAAVLTLPILGLFALRALAPEFGFRISALVIAGAVLLATGVLAYLQWRLLLNPITALVRRAALMKAGRSGVPLRHYGTREMHDLGHAMLDMGAALQNREAAVRAFTDHVTHELKTPLTAIRGAAEMLEDGEGAADRRLLAAIREAADQMERQLAALRQAAAAREPMPGGSVRLADLEAGLLAAHPGLRLAFHGREAVLPIAPARLEAVLTQLLTNARQHGASHVSVSASDGAGLLVADDGPGISEGNRDRIFAPFFTTRREDGGTGMGLNIAQAILQAQGASIRLEPGQGGGTAFRIEF